MVGNGRAIGVFSGKGGVGKTTTAVNLAAALALDFKRNVALVDTNISSSSLGFHLGMHYSPYNINHVLRGEVSIDKAVGIHHSGIKVLPASIKLQDSFTKQYLLPKVVNYMSKYSEFVILDTAPSIGEETLWALRSVDEAVLVTTPDTPSVIEVIKLAKLANNYNVKVLGIIINKYNKSGVKPDEIANLCQAKILGIVPEDENVRKSIEKNTPIVHYRPYSKASLAFKEISSKISGDKYKKSVSDKILSVFS